MSDLPYTQHYLLMTCKKLYFVLTR